mgnify:CR=1 FL=1
MLSFHGLTLVQRGQEGIGSLYIDFPCNMSTEIQSCNGINWCVFQSVYRGIDSGKSDCLVYVYIELAENIMSYDKELPKPLKAHGQLRIEARFRLLIFPFILSFQCE